MTAGDDVRAGATGTPADARRAVWRRRPDDDEDDGPFFPPEPPPAAASDRPRPRPGPRPPVADPQVELARPRPRPRPPAPPQEPPREQREPPPEPAAGAEQSEPKHEPAEPKAEKPSWRQRLRGSRVARLVTKLLIVLVVAGVAAVVLRSYVVAPYYIPSASMEPTLVGGGGATDDRILVDKVTYHIHDPHEGDIVVFNRPSTWDVTDKTLVKRIIGLPGDIVTLRNGLVYVNGMRLTENYVNKACGPAPTRPLTKTSQWRVPMDDYFVMGDNRCNSDDSRAFGPIPRSTIVGHVVLIVWPLSRFGTP